MIGMNTGKAYSQEEFLVLSEQEMINEQAFIPLTSHAEKIKKKIQYRLPKVYEDFPDEYEYEVNPENQCQGLKIWAKKQGHNSFKGFVQYSDHFKEFYLTMDGITYTPLKDAFNIKPVIS